MTVSRSHMTSVLCKAACETHTHTQPEVIDAGAHRKSKKGRMSAAKWCRPAEQSMVSPSTSATRMSHLTLWQKSVFSQGLNSMWCDWRHRLMQEAVEVTSLHWTTSLFPYGCFSRVYVRSLYILDEINDLESIVKAAGFIR